MKSRPRKRTRRASTSAAVDLAAEDVGWTGAGGSGSGTVPKDKRLQEAHDEIRRLTKLVELLTSRLAGKGAAEFAQIGGQMGPPPPLAPVVPSMTGKAVATTPALLALCANVGTDISIEAGAGPSKLPLPPLPPPPLPQPAWSFSDVLPLPPSVGADSSWQSISQSGQRPLNLIEAKPRDRLSSLQPLLASDTHSTVPQTGSLVTAMTTSTPAPPMSNVRHTDDSNTVIENARVLLSLSASPNHSSPPRTSNIITSASQPFKALAAGSEEPSSQAQYHTNLPSFSVPPSLPATSRPASATHDEGTGSWAKPEVLRSGSSGAHSGPRLRLSIPSTSPARPWSSSPKSASLAPAAATVTGCDGGSNANNARQQQQQKLAPTPTLSAFLRASAYALPSAGPNNVGGNSHGWLFGRLLGSDSGRDGQTNDESSKGLSGAGRGMKEPSQGDQACGDARADKASEDSMVGVQGAAAFVDKQVEQPFPPVLSEMPAESTGGPATRATTSDPEQPPCRGSVRIQWGPQPNDGRFDKDCKRCNLDQIKLDSAENGAEDGKNQSGVRISLFGFDDSDEVDSVHARRFDEALSKMACEKGKGKDEGGVPAG